MSISSTGLSHHELHGARVPDPIAVTFKVASQISGLGLTTLWKYAKEKRIRVIRPPGTRRTLIDYPSLKNLFAPEETKTPQRRKRGRPPKVRAVEAAT
jgi:hypothetical protein